MKTKTLVLTTDNLMDAKQKVKPCLLGEKKDLSTTQNLKEKIKKSTDNLVKKVANLAQKVLGNPTKIF
jgi:hypothetical protein